MINREQANLIADLARTVRASWDTRGIVAVLLSDQLAHRPLAELAAATLRAAADPRILLPSGIALNGDHWLHPEIAAAKAAARAGRRDRDAELRVREQETAACRWCDPQGRLGNGHLCTHDQDPAVRAEIAHLRASRARANIRPAPQPDDREDQPA